MSFSSLFSLPTTRHVRLEAGQALHECVAAGTTLHLLDGSVDVLAPPQWLAESFVRGSGRLGPGSSYVVTARGWLTVSASTCASLCVEPAASPGVRVLRVLVAGLRRVATGRAVGRERA